MVEFSEVLMTVFDVDSRDVRYVSIYDPISLDECVQVPQSISRFQARAALMDAGLLADVELAISAADPIVHLAWAEAVEWRRDSPTILAIATALGLSEEDIDNLFIAAAEIKA